MSMAVGLGFFHEYEAIAVWARAAVAAEAEHVSRIDDEERSGKRVRFTHFDLSAVEPPRDTVRHSSDHAEAVARRLAEVARAGKEVAIRRPEELRFFADQLEDFAEKAHFLACTNSHFFGGVEVAQIRGAARLWASEARSLVGNTPETSPARQKLSALLSSVLRFHLRRLLNAPPPPGTKASSLVATTPEPKPLKRRSSFSRTPLKDKNGDNATTTTEEEEEEERYMKQRCSYYLQDDDLQEENRPNTRASKQRRKSRRASIVSSVFDEDDEAHPYAWCRSAVHRLVKLEVLDDNSPLGGDGSLASQVTSALASLAACRRGKKTLALSSEKKKNAKEASSEETRKRNQNPEVSSSPKTSADVDEADARLDCLAVSVAAACGHNFLYKLLTFPRVGNAIRDAGGWTIIEHFSAMASTYGDATLAAQFGPFADVATFKETLAEGLEASDELRRKTLAELSAIVRAFGTKRRLKGAKDIANAAQFLSRSAMLYPQLIAASTSP